MRSEEVDAAPVKWLKCDLGHWGGTRTSKHSR